MRENSVEPKARQKVECKCVKYCNEYKKRKLESILKC